MANYKPWLKMWVDWIDDPKMNEAAGGLTLAEQAVWWRLCALAQKCAAEGSLVKDCGDPYTIEEILDIIRIRDSQRPVFDSMVKKMEKQRSIHWADGIMVVTNFLKRQKTAASETPEAVRERVKKHRQQQQKKKGSPNTPSKKENNKEIELEEELELEKIRYVTDQNSLHNPPVAKIKISYTQIVDFFHEKCPSLPRVREITEKRKKAMKNAYLNTQKSLHLVTNPLQIFEELFLKAEASDFLSGRRSPVGDHSNWRCSFDWLLEDRNRVKVLEGNYDNQGEKDGKRIQDTGRDPLRESRERGLQVTED